MRARARRAYERARVLDGLLAAWPVPLLIALAVVLHERVSAVAVAAAAGLFVLLVAATWRGRAYRRGATAGVLAGLPPLVVPAVVIAARGEVHCAGCTPSMGNVLACTVLCVATALVCGLAVGLRAARDREPVRFAAAALLVATLVGLLACGATGVGGGLGVIVGFAAGGIPTVALARRGA